MGTERQLRIEKAIEEVTLETENWRNKLRLLYKALTRESLGIEKREEAMSSDITQSHEPTESSEKEPSPAAQETKETHSVPFQGSRRIQSPESAAEELALKIHRGIHSIDCHFILGWPTNTSVPRYECDCHIKHTANMIEKWLVAQLYRARMEEQAKASQEQEKDHGKSV